MISPGIWTMAETWRGHAEQHPRAHPRPRNHQQLPVQCDSTRRPGVRSGGYLDIRSSCSKQAAAVAASAKSVYFRNWNYVSFRKLKSVLRGLQTQRDLSTWNTTSAQLYGVLYRLWAIGYGVHGTQHRLTAIGWSLIAHLFRGAGAPAAPIQTIRPDETQQKNPCQDFDRLTDPLDILISHRACPRTDTAW